MKPYYYSIKVLRVIDGDTIDAEIDLGYYIKIKKRIRLHGINTPEIRLQSKIKDIEERKAEKSRGLIAKARLREICDNNEIFVESVGIGKYGRVLGILYFNRIVDTPERQKTGWRPIEKLISINNLLLEEGHAEKYIK